MIKVGIIGMGTMGRGIAQVAASAGCELLAFDSYEPILEKSKLELDKSLAHLVSKTKLSDSQASEIKNRYHWCKNLNQLFQADLIIEAIQEDLILKKEVFNKLSQIISDQCILASNTSSLSITSLASAVNYPERFLGIHFFNPATLMPLVELIPAIQTQESVTKQAFEFLTQWGKSPIIVKDTPGFIVNRIARPYYAEAIRILEEGIADIITIDWAMTELGGFKMGPFALMDFIGHDVNYQVTETVFKSFFYDPKFKPSFTQKRLVEAGFLGRKSGRGFYKYEDGSSIQAPVKNEKLGQQILDRILVMLINEAADALFWKISSKEDIEIAMIKGVNYPKGLLHWADEIGIDECVRRMDALYNLYREDRYRCSPLLRKMADDAEVFF